MQNVKTLRFISSFLVFVPAIVYAHERIISFDSDITVHTDSSMTVVETIRVQAELQSIKHGIVREFPTTYVDSAGKKHFVDFTIDRVERDGLQERYFIKKESNGERIFMGKKNRVVSPGEHIYRIAYTTGFQLGFFKHHDELYWNVTGNGWRLPIEHVTAVVHLPKTIPLSAIHAEAYTGAFGSQARNYHTEIRTNSVYFEAGPFATREGLTIVVTWPKGFVTPPKGHPKQFWRWLLFTILFLLSALLIIAYIIRVIIFFWPQKHAVVIPLYTPPAGLTPSAMRYIARKKYDTVCLTSEIIRLAVQGVIAIHVEKKFFSKIYTLEKLKDSSDPLVAILFAEQKKVTLNQSNATSIQHGVDVLRKKLKEHDDCFENLHWAGRILFFLLLSLFFVFATHAHSFLGGFNTFYAIVATFFIYCAVMLTARKRYAPKGRQLRTEIDGFKMFLSATESERLRILSSPEEAVSEYERYLPYAVALSVEKNWTQQFAPVFAQLARQGHAYVPVWYSGRHFNTNDIHSFSADISAFTGAISSSLNIPGSSSGSGGKGSSGGGGGGGGGGGW